MADSTDYEKWFQRASQDIKLVDIINKDGIEGLEDSSVIYVTRLQRSCLRHIL